jgi:hypothetical protein
MGDSNQLLHRDDVGNAPVMAVYDVKPPVKQLEQLGTTAREA